MRSKEILEGIDVEDESGVVGKSKIAAY